MESLEADQPIACLKSFFSEFRSEGTTLRSAPATDDELMNLGSQQLLSRLREAEEKNSLLMYQMSLFKEALEQGKEQEKKAEAPKEIESLSEEAKNARDAAVKEIEGQGGPDGTDLRILNFLLRQHLLSRGLKMTAVTLSEELRDGGSAVSSLWSSVSLDMPEPPDLFTLLRYYYSAGAQRAALEVAKEPTLCAQLEDKSAMADRLAAELTEAREELALAQKRIESAENERKRLLSVWEQDLEEAKRVARKEALQQLQKSAPTTPRLPAENTEGVAQPLREEAAQEAPETVVDDGMAGAEILFARRRFARQSMFSAAPEGEGLEGNSRIGEQIRALGKLKHDDYSGLVNVIADCLPFVIPGIILRSREEIVPVLLGCIRQSSNEKRRDQLTGLLVGLVKKPDQAQRQTIVQACAILAGLIGRERTERELVPQSWESLTDKSEERRLLVCEFSGGVMPFVRDSRRAAIFMNILKPLLEDPSPAVRASAAKSLGILITFQHDLELFGEVLSLFRKILLDLDENVSKVALNEVLPKLADWACSGFQLESALLMPLLRDVEQHIKSSHGDRISLKRLAIMSDAVAAVLPFFHKVVLGWAPFANEVLHCTSKDDAKRFTLPGDAEGALQERLRDFLKHERDLHFAADDLNWTAVQFAIQEFAPLLVNMLSAVSLAERRPSYLSLVGILDAFWKLFDTAFTISLFDPVFARAMDKDIASRSSLLPAYVATMVVRKSDLEVQAYFRRAVIAIGLEEEGWSFAPHMVALRAALELMGTRMPQRLDSVLAVLRELVISESPRPREVTAFLLERLVSISSEAAVKSVILPAIATLSNDVDVKVRLKVVNVLGSLMSGTSDAKILEPVSFQLDALLDSHTPEILEEMMVMLTETCAQLDGSFRDKFLMGKIRRAAELNAKQEDPAVRSRVGNSVFTAYKVFLECGPSLDTLVQDVAPGLELLQSQLTVEENIQSITAALAAIKQKAGKADPSSLAASSASVIAPAATADASAAGPAAAANGAASSAAAPGAAATAAAVGGPEVPAFAQPQQTGLQKAKNLLERFKFGKDK